MKKFLSFNLFFLLIACTSAEETVLSWPSDLPVYDHIVIVVLENKDYSEIIGNKNVPYINNVLKAEGAIFTKSYGEEHFSQGNYFWFFSGDNQNVGFNDHVPSSESNSSYPFHADNLASQLLKKGLSFKGYSQSLPEIGSKVAKQGAYARKHVPWVSFSNVPDGKTADTSCNLRFKDFPDPSAYEKLPTVSFVIPDLDHDMHNCYPPNCNTGSDAGDMQCCIKKGDLWLQANLDSYYQWAKQNNSLLIVTFDENDDKRGYQGLTNPMVANAPSEKEKSFCLRSKMDREYCEDLENRVVTIFAGARIIPGEYEEGSGITHVTILRTIEAMYGLGKSGKQQPNAVGSSITDDKIITDVFKKEQ